MGQHEQQQDIRIVPMKDTFARSIRFCEMIARVLVVREFSSIGFDIRVINVDR